MSEVMEPKEGKEKKTASFIKRFWTGAVLLIVLGTVLYLRGWYFAVTAFIAVTIAIHEELNALMAGGHRPVCWTSYVALGLAVPSMMFYSSLAMIPILTLLCFFVILQVMRRENPDLVDIMVSILPMFSVVLPGMCLIGLLDTEPLNLQAMLLVLVFAVAVGGDTFAYFVGSAVGGPKLCPHISPNKTIAGSIGGLVGSILCAVLVGRLFSLANADFLGYPPLWGDVLVGLFGGVAGQVGDLFASMVKRHCKMKDFGKIFPGHGGMMDRMDSIFFTCIIVYSYRALILALL
ncbi:MAG: CDP-archaeol synthase [Eubacteriales bacterium]|nr:CDP-archaeol synthase [Eubacteriales bacterium]